MSGISSSVGLMSGINTGDLINQLMQIEARTLNAVNTRIARVNTEKTAWMSISANVLATKASLTAMKEEDAFLATNATSSNDSVLSATAEAGASLGTYQFTVHRLVQSHQMISGGFADSDATAIGAGTITFETGHGRLDGATPLDFLNGQSGISRGSIRITDRAGVTADIDLTTAVNVADVLDAINNHATLGVAASISGDSIVLTDTTALPAGTITVADIGTGQTASDLGIAGSAVDAPLAGSDINYITTQTSLNLLNDGNGIERTSAGADLNITLRDGTLLDVNLYGLVNGEDITAHTIGDVLDAINNHINNAGKLVASISDDGNGIKLVDTTGVAGDLIVADASGSYAATQLGLAGTYSGGLGDLEVAGDTVIAGLNTVLLKNLVGGDGVTLGTV
ncbi:MAG: hypothetical protein HQ546_05620, partial [Planctomycetes bacterium]|nr:hypothetical protein [Planctomycetota bacterium]